jgi:hypothetical protein
MLAPIALLAVFAGLLGFCTFMIDPALQQILDLSVWPLIARFTHDGIPALLVAVLWVILALLAINTRYR